VTSAAYGPGRFSSGLTNFGDARLSSRGTDCRRKVKQMRQPCRYIGEHNAARGSPGSIGESLLGAVGRAPIELWIYDGRGRPALEGRR
jgi:hypothetical protein